MKGRIDDSSGFSVSWTLEEPQARTAHALVDDGCVWLVDPVDWAPALERVAALGEPVAVLQLLDRHRRDAAAIAARLRVPHITVPGVLPATPFAVAPLIERPWWRESALWWEARRVLVVPEAIGTARYFALGRAAGVHPMLRLAPPSGLRAYAPEHLLVGHGPPLHEGAAPALDDALARSRRDLGLLARELPGMLRAARR